MNLSDERVKKEDAIFNSKNLGVYTGESIIKCIKDIKEELKNPRLDRFSVEKIINFHIGDALSEENDD